MAYRHGEFLERCVECAAPTSSRCPGCRDPGCRDHLYPFDDDALCRDCLAASMDHAFMRRAGAGMSIAFWLLALPGVLLMVSGVSVVGGLCVTMFSLAQAIVFTAVARQRPALPSGRRPRALRAPPAGEEHARSD